MLTAETLNQRYPNFKFLLVCKRNDVTHFSVDDGSSIYWNVANQEGSSHYTNYRFGYFKSLKELDNCI